MQSAHQSIKMNGSRSGDEMRESCLGGCNWLVITQSIVTPEEAGQTKPARGKPETDPLHTDPR